MTIEFLKANDLILFEAVAGSRSFGLDTPSSYTDIKGVFYLPKDMFYGMQYVPQISNETNDIVYYEIGRFIELLTKNNPNILELLASPQDCIIYKHAVMDKITLKDFLSKLCKDTFAGYAATQIKKARGLKKKIINPLPKERKTLLEFCHVLQRYNTLPLPKWLSKENLNQSRCGLMNIPHCKGMYAVFYDSEDKLGYKGIVKKESSNDISLSSIPKGEKEIGYLFFNQDAYSTYCKEYKEYWDWIDKRNEERYNTNVTHGKNYDSKNMMHTIRLLQSAEQILSTGNLNIRVNNREELLTIKAGAIDYDELLQRADDLLNSVQSFYDTCVLPDFPDIEEAENLLVAIRRELYG